MTALIMELVNHFCLGSNTNKAFAEFLLGWEFFLEFEINKDSFSLSRKTDKQNEIFLNGKKYNIREFNSHIESLIFNIPEQKNKLSFRSLLPRFLRRNKKDYIDPRWTSADEEDYTALIRNLFLLGLDIELPKNKHALRAEQTSLDSLKDSFNKDTFIRNFYTGDKDVSLQITHLEEKVNSLNINLSQFKVADDYLEIEKEANNINSELSLAKNRKTIIENSLGNIEKSIQIKPDITKEKILNCYQEMLSAFNPESIKKIDDIERFNSQLIKSRLNRLSQEKLKLKAQLEELHQNIDELTSLLNEKLSYLSDKRALDQYAAVSQQKSELMAKLQKIKDYQSLLHKIEGDLLNIQKQFAEESIKTNQYLTETESEREKNFSLFSRLVKMVYPNAPAGISLKNNTGINKIRYDLDVRIEADGSDGINSAKIFCYDLSILIMAHNHLMQFIFHDSRLFSDIDPRQRAILFKLAHKYSRENGKQYIATVNQDEIESMRSEFTESDFNEIFKDSTVLTLKDDMDESKLLGVKVDMHYS
jgi:uncharacterized protein YydD (DUF2326 family)